MAPDLELYPIFLLIRTPSQRSECWHYSARAQDGPQEMEKKLSSSQAKLGQATGLAVA